MDCRTFRKHHVAFVDDLLPGIDMVAMQCHVSECEACARHDMLIRRSLMLFRSIPVIEPSADFGARLNARLRESRPMDGMTHAGRGLGTRSMFAAAASVLIAGYVALAAVERLQPVEIVELSPAVAYEPAPEPPPIANPVVLASVSAGIPLWSAMLLAEQAPAHFAAEFRLTGWGR